MRKHVRYILILWTLCGTTLWAQDASRLVAASFRGMLNGIPLVLQDSTSYTYSDGRGGDLDDEELPFDNSFDMDMVQGTLTLASGHCKAYNGLDHLVADSTVIFVNGSPMVTGFVRWTRDAQGRPLTESWFSGTDSIYYRNRSYTPTGKLAMLYYAQPFGGGWAETTETYTYNAQDSLTDKVVVSDFLGYSFHWEYSPDGRLVHREELTPSGDLFVDYYYHTNGKPLAQRDSAGPLGWQNDSLHYAWNATFDSVSIMRFNAAFGFSVAQEFKRKAYDAAGRQVELVLHEDQGGSWVPLSRQATTWSPGGTVIVDSAFHWNGSMFIHAFNEEFDHDADGRMLEQRIRANVNGAMVDVWRRTNAYNAWGQLTRSAMDDTSAGNWSTVTDQRYYYEDYATSTPTLPFTMTNLHAWPNPANSSIRFVLPAGFGSSVRFEVCDMQGHRLTPVIDGWGSDRVMSLEGLAAGSYLLRACFEGRCASVCFQRF
ncbi:MAG: hypothetical protein WAU70_09370 [Flavobacteriales bacterium]